MKRLVLAVSEVLESYRFVVGLSRSLVVQRLMWSFTVVEDEVLFHGEYSFNRRVVRLDVYFLLLYSSPESFNEYIIRPSSSAIHTNTNTI